jgi:hypothetical protein
MGIKWCFQEKEQMSYLEVFVFSQRLMHKNHEENVRKLGKNMRMIACQQNKQRGE